MTFGSIKPGNEQLQVISIFFLFFSHWTSYNMIIKHEQNDCLRMLNWNVPNENSVCSEEEKVALYSQYKSDNCFHIARKAVFLARHAFCLMCSYTSQIRLVSISSISCIRRLEQCSILRDCVTSIFTFLNTSASVWCSPY